MGSKAKKNDDNLKVALVGTFPPPRGGMSMLIDALSTRLAEKGVEVFKVDVKGRERKSVYRIGARDFTRMADIMSKLLINRDKYDVINVHANSYMSYLSLTLPLIVLSKAVKRPIAYLGALWNIHSPLVETPADAPEHLRRRTGFGGGAILVPASFPGFTPEDAKMLYRAALAHVGAHHRFTRAKFPAAGLKPLQMALVSLVEDARVEHLAMGMMPGLRRLWARFHVARPEGPPVAISLMARLSRALLDPDYDDPHGWVEKGRMLFDEAVATDAGDQQLSRRIGGLLGNDIGQMRLQFDAKTYVVQPAYRDDNLGIWDFGAEEQSPTELEAMVDGAARASFAHRNGCP